MTGQLIAVFISTHETLRAERAFKDAGIKVRSTVKPRKIGSNCQLAITFPLAKIDEVRTVVDSGDFDLVGFYRQGENGNWQEMKKA